jgi:flavin-dependent dehydrogenase
LKIAIAGAGTSGAYLYRLLKNRDITCDIYGKESKTHCGINPCAWGTSQGFVALVKTAGLVAEKYILQRVNHVFMDDVRITGELMTFNKPAFVKDLLGEVRVRQDPLDLSAYDRVIDATGMARAFLPAIRDDLLLPCVQQRLTPAQTLENRIRLNGIGYAWSFPLSDHGYHIGCGSLVHDPKRLLDELGWGSNGSGGKSDGIICACAGRVRITGPHQSLPFVIGAPPIEIWGVGESIGCVAPLAGDGVLSGMKSAQILIDHWDDPEDYTAGILKEFRWMKDERRVINKLLNSDPLGVKDAWVLKTNSKRMGMEVGIREALMLLNNLRK